MLFLYLVVVIRTKIQKLKFCIPDHLQNGILAFYPFSNGSLNDFSGNNYHLSNPTSASPGQDRLGNQNCAFKFNEDNDEFLTYVNPTFLDDIKTSSFSISLWYKNESTNLSGYELLIGRDINLHCPDTFGQWSVGLYDIKKPVFGINSYSIWWNNDTVLTQSEWRHLVVTNIGTDLKLYLNGELTAENSSTGCNQNHTTQNIGDLFLGKEFSGLLDDVIIYNRILSDTEVNELYNLTPCCR